MMSPACYQVFIPTRWSMLPGDITCLLAGAHSHQVLHATWWCLLPATWCSARWVLWWLCRYSTCSSFTISRPCGKWPRDDHEMTVMSRRDDRALSEMTTSPSRRLKWPRTVHDEMTTRDNQEKWPRPSVAAWNDHELSTTKWPQEITKRNDRMTGWPPRVHSVGRRRRLDVGRWRPRANSRCCRSRPDRGNARLTHAVRRPSCCSPPRRPPRRNRPRRLPAASTSTFTSEYWLTAKCTVYSGIFFRGGGQNSLPPLQTYNFPQPRTAAKLCTIVNCLSFFPRFV